MRFYNNNFAFVFVPEFYADAVEFYLILISYQFMFPGIGATFQVLGQRFRYWDNVPGIGTTFQVLGQRSRYLGNVLGIGTTFRY